MLVTDPSEHKAAMDDDTPLTRTLPAFGRRSKSNSQQSTPRHQPHQSAAYPNKTDSARGSLSGTAGKGGKLESILSFIAAREEEAADGSLDSNTTVSTSVSATRSASPLHTSTRSARAVSIVSSAAASSLPAHHHRSMSAAAGYTHSPSAIRPPLPSTISHSRTTPSSPSLSATHSPTLTSSTSSSSTSTLSPFEAYKQKLHSLTNTITTLETTLTTLTQQHNTTLAQQQHTHNQHITALTHQYDGRLNEQLTFIQQLVTSKQQLTSEIDSNTDTMKQYEQQLLNRHVEIELEAEEKLQKKLENLQVEWREKEMRHIKSNISKAMEKEIDKLKIKQTEEVKALDTVWKEKFNTTKEEMEKKLIQKESEVRRQCMEEKNSEKEKEARRCDELIRQLTIDFAMKQSEVSRLHEQERRSERQQWESEQQAAVVRRQTVDSQREERLNSEWQQRLTALQQSCVVDRQRYEQECEEKVRCAVSEAEQQLREVVRRESEAELTHVIERLGEETVQLSKSERSKHRQMIESLQQERMDERNEWQKNEKGWKEKIERMSEQLTSGQKRSEKQCREWTVRWTEAEEWKRQLDQLTSERQQSAIVQQHSRQHDTDALLAVQQQLTRSSERWKRERQQLMDEQQEERVRWQQRQDEKCVREMSEVERRVKETVRKKDEVIDGLQKELRRLQGQIVAMNDTIEQQKHELLSLG